MPSWARPRRWARPKRCWTKLEELITDVWDAHPDFESMMRSPRAVPASEKARILNEVLGGKASRSTLNFLLVLEPTGSAGSFAAGGAASAGELGPRKNGRLPVVVRSAVALDEPTRLQRSRTGCSQLLNADADHAVWRLIRR